MKEVLLRRQKRRTTESDISRGEHKAMGDVPKENAILQGSGVPDSSQPYNNLDEFVSFSLLGVEDVFPVPSDVPDQSALSFGLENSYHPQTVIDDSSQSNEFYSLSMLSDVTNGYNLPGLYEYSGGMEGAQNSLPSILEPPSGTPDSNDKESPPPTKRSRKISGVRRHSSSNSQCHKTGTLSPPYIPCQRRTYQQEGSRSKYSFNFMNDPSPDSIQQRLASSSCTSQVARGLMRIYHDSMENAFSCWLTEKTCPYSIATPTLHPGSGCPESMAHEWGSNWSNRICERVCRLDRNASFVRNRPLTKSEERDASRVLHLAIMSFATQWAQSSQRSTMEYSSFMEQEASNQSTLPPPNTRSAFDNTAGIPPGNSSPAPLEFDRSIQETFWYQARQALLESQGIESFRVIFAHIIFSLTQRPLDIDQHFREMGLRNTSTSAPLHTSSFNSQGFSGHSSTSSIHSSFCEMKESKQDELDKVIDVEGPPLFLETALRQLFSWRCKLEALERQRATRISKSTSQGFNYTRTDPLCAADRKTFNLLFWLGIMFDTLSSVMNKRPLVVSDEDSDILYNPNRDSSPSPALHTDFLSSEPTPHSSRFPKDSDSNLWGQFFLQEKAVKYNHHITRWPCSYEDAASTLCDAAPIKVLLFRRITNLQTLLSRRSSPSKLEAAITRALEVYQYWNMTYGPFIHDCTAHHDSLPPRIQSWYVVLAGHWHLAGMLLADTIEAIDAACLGLSPSYEFRQASKQVACLRRQNADAVAELGRCASPRPEASFPRGEEFHFAVNKGALLTEPWTVVLIRAFSKAGSLFLHSVDGVAEDGMVAVGSEREEAKRKCGFCIEALWVLGKKSDMAFLAATALSRALSDRTRDRT